MGRILFATWDGGGNVPPATTVAAELRRRGHDVRFLGHQTQRADLEGQGFAFSAYDGVRPFSAANPGSPLRQMALFSDPAMAAAVRAHLEREPADLVVADALLLGVLAGLSRSGQRYATLVHLFDGYRRGPWARGPIGLLARVRGMSPTRLWDEAAVEIVATLPELDPGAQGPLPPHRRFTGPPPLHRTGARPRA
jgi:hypothetical protein